MLAWYRARRIAYLRTYVLCIAAASVLWESAQMPLYTIWNTATLGALVADVLKCTVANIAIATCSLATALLLTGWTKRWAGGPSGTILVTCLLGVGYTIYSEWVNVYVRETWAYSDLMPIVPGMEVGLSPLAQWVVLPSTGVLLAERWSR